MFVDSPCRTLAIAKSHDGTTADGMHFQIALRRKFAAFFLEHRDAVPTVHDYEQAAEFLTEITYLAFSAAQVQDLLSLYPHARIKLAVESIHSADAQQQLSFSAAHFFLGCSWPQIGDDVDATAFVDLLRRQAFLMGFEAARAEGALT